MSNAPAFQPVKREPVYLKVARAIEAEIVSGALKPGAVLPTEAELCAQFEVTRSSVREGIRSLEQSGLIARGAAKRLIVAQPDAGDIAKAASRSLALSGATFGEVWEALATFYPEAARLASTKFGDRELEELNAAHERFCALELSDREGIVAEAAEFFHVIARLIDNQVMLALLDALNQMIAASLALVIDQTPNAVARIKTAQIELISAIGAHNGDEAARWMAKHIDDLKRGYSVAGRSLDARIKV